jgi:hypothetical protein
MKVIDAPKFCGAYYSSPPGLTRWSMLKRRMGCAAANFRKRFVRMDCRVKPGNDEGVNIARYIKSGRGT